MKKTDTIFVCQNCGHQSRKWLGKCPECGEWNSLVQERAQPVKKGSARNNFNLRQVSALPFTEIESQDDGLVPSVLDEFELALGGGIVPRNLVLLAREP